MKSESDTSVKLAEYLLKIKAVKLQPNDPFKWSSGWNSPIYCDNRITLSYPEIRTFIKEEMAAAILDKFEGATALCGVATAGVAIGGLVADHLNMPYAYCRPKPKEHGMKNQLEGRLDKSDNIIVVEDLISTGGSSLKVVEFLRNNGYNVLGMVSIFTYGFDLASDNFKNANCPFLSLGSYNELLEHAQSEGIIKESDLPVLESWRQDPANWNA
jgi:orotate phosphoribosyltransferase